MRLVREMANASEEVWETSGFSVGGIAETAEAFISLIVPTAHRPKSSSSMQMGDYLPGIPGHLSLGNSSSFLKQPCTGRYRCTVFHMEDAEPMTRSSTHDYLPEELSQRSALAKRA